MPSSKSGSKAGAAKRNTTRSASASKKRATKPVVSKVTSVKSKTTSTKVQNTNIDSKAYPAIIFAEAIGTFVLTLVALATMQQTGSLYIGLTLAVIMLSIGAISGAHINPAVTFGLWAARKVKTSAVPVYWIAQFVGAILAILLLGAFSGNGYPLNFTHFTTIEWGLLGAEVLGAAIFMFGWLAVASSTELTKVTKAFGIGLSLTVGLIASTTALTFVQTAQIESFQQDTTAQKSDDSNYNYPHVVYVKGTTVNPAVALASTEYTDAELSGMQASLGDAKNSRLDVNTIVGTLVGAAIGTNLYLLVAAANQRKN